MVDATVSPHSCCSSSDSSSSSCSSFPSPSFSSSSSFLNQESSVFLFFLLTVSGDSSITHIAVGLTQPLSMCPNTNDSEFRIRGAFYSNPVRFLDAETKDLTFFLTHFTTSITQLCTSGDGVTFLITSHLEGFSCSKGFTGLYQDSFFSVVNDINGSHVGIDLNTVESVAFVNAGIDLLGGKEVIAWLEYRDDLKMVNKPPGPVLEAKSDLFKPLKELVYVGLCTSNAKGFCDCIVESWNGSLPSVIPMHFWEEQDCFMRGDSSIDMSSVDVVKTNIEMDFSVRLVGLAALVLCGKKRVVSARSRRGCCRVDTNMVPTSLFREEINSAAIGFDRGRIVGEGASGEVVVKRFERANVLSHLRYKNLVQPHGWCCEVNELVLEYDLMPNGSFIKILHRSFNLAVVLYWYWMQSLGVASAVSHHHEEYCERQIIHTDVRIGNIMADAEFNAKPGDCGLAEAYEHSSITRMGYLFIQYVLSGVPTVKKDVWSFCVVVIDVAIAARTMGNVALECVCSGGLTVKTDVCSFGVVLLKVAMGRKPMEDDGTVIVDWVWRLWEVGKLIQVACSRMTGRFDKVEMGRMLISGLACVHQNHAKRSTVEEAARILQGEAPLPFICVVLFCISTD